DFQLFERGERLGVLARSALIYFTILFAFGAGLLGLGAGVARLSAWRGFPGQIGFILFACFFLVFNFYAQQYLFPGESVFAPLPIATLAASAALGAGLGILAKRLFTATRLRARSAGTAVASLAILALLLVLETPPGAREPEALPAGADSKPSVLFITIDTLRADHLGCYGDLLVDTPAIDRLAATGTRFSTCITPVPLTLPSHAAMLTARYPPALGTRRNGDVLPEGEITLAEILRSNGYQTAAVVGAVVLDVRGGLAQGFDSYYDRMAPPDAYFLRIMWGRLRLLMRAQMDELSPDTIVQKRADQVTREALRWLARRGPRPWFLWVHYFDVHAPYNPPAPFANRYVSEYKGEVAFVDQEIGKLLEGLDATGGRDDLLIALTSDHGEGLGEHGYAQHRRRIYEEQVRVPLILNGKGRVPAGLEIEAPVRTIDIMPTLLDLLGIGVPEAAHGRPVQAFLDGGGGPRASYIETMDSREAFRQLTGIREQRWKYYRSVDGSARELYDLSGDPGETKNLLSLGRAPIVERMEERLNALAALFDNPAAPADTPVDPGHREMLRSLGYVD
ncbi:MAG: sulfatase, partial [Myxococcota bacterium]